MIEYRLSGAPMATVTTRIARAGGSTPTLIQGYAALYGVETTIGNFFRERIMAGAFRDAIRRDDVRALFNHEAHFVLGRTASGTLRLSEDAKGLKFEIDINAYDSMARDVAARIQRGDVSGSSFGFIVHEDDERWEYDRTSRMPLRTLLRVGLIDVSPVTFPAYITTTVAARSLAGSRHREGGTSITIDKASVERRAEHPCRRFGWDVACLSTRLH